MLRSLVLPVLAGLVPGLLPGLVPDVVPGVLPGVVPTGAPRRPAADARALRGDARAEDPHPVHHAIRPGERVEVHLGPDAPRLDGVFPSRTFRFEPGFEGRLQVWARGHDADPFLRVHRDSILRNVPTTVENDDGGGGRDASVGIVVQPFDPITIELGAKREGRVELVVVGAPETDATKAAKRAARRRLGEAQTLVAEGRFDAARAALSEVLASLAGVDEPTHSVGLASVARSAGHTATRAGALDEARRAWSLALEHDRYLLPPDHPVAVRNRETAASSYSALGAFDDARVLYEGVLAVDAARLPPDDARLLRVRSGLGEVLLMTGDHDGAREQFGRVLEALERRYPAGDARVRRAREDLARVPPPAEPGG